VDGINIMTGYIYDAGGRRVAKGSITIFVCDPTTNGFSEPRTRPTTSSIRLAHLRYLLALPTPDHNPFPLKPPNVEILSSPNRKLQSNKAKYQVSYCQ